MKNRKYKGWLIVALDGRIVKFEQKNWKGESISTSPMLFTLKKYAKQWQNKSGITQGIKTKLAKVLIRVEWE